MDFLMMAASFLLGAAVMMGIAEFRHRTAGTTYWLPNERLCLHPGCLGGADPRCEGHLCAKHCFEYDVYTKTKSNGEQGRYNRCLDTWPDRKDAERARAEVDELNKMSGGQA